MCACGCKQNWARRVQGGQWGGVIPFSNLQRARLFPLWRRGTVSKADGTQDPSPPQQVCSGMKERSSKLLTPSRDSLFFPDPGPSPTQPVGPQCPAWSQMSGGWVRKVSTRAHLRLSPCGYPFVPSSQTGEFLKGPWSESRRNRASWSPAPGLAGTDALTPPPTHSHHCVMQPRSVWSLPSPLGSHQGLTTPLPEHKFIWHLDEMVLTAS